MTNVENETVNLDPAVEHLSQVFKGGRISGWVQRNRGLIEEEDSEGLELEMLLKHSPGFAELTKDLSGEEIIQKIIYALIEADKSPLSATNYRPHPNNPNILINKKIACRVCPRKQ